MNAIGAILVLAFCAIGFTQSRRLAALSLVAGMLFITQGQAINLGLNFFALRFIEVAVFARIISKGELKKVAFTKVDRWLLIFFSTLVVIYTIRTGEVNAYQLGTAVDAWFVYFSFRALITTTEDYTAFMKGSVSLLVPFALLMTFEAATGRNLFSIMGGVSESPIMREGHYRCQGSFMIAITAGSLGSTYFPLFIGLMFQKAHRKWASIGLAACFAIVITSRSSGPLMAILTGILGWCCWFIRGKMQWVRRGIVAALVGLHLTMSQPVWFIFDRISGILGGDGWHRSNLIDKFVEHRDQWWQLGMPFEATSTWAATQLPWGGVDVTNYYVSIGIVAGLLTFIFFIKFLVVCFQAVGRTAKLLKSQGQESVHLEAIIWGIGCTLAAHTVNLTAVIYWDQSYVFWYLHLALVSSMSAYLLLNKKNPQNLRSKTPGIDPTQTAKPVYPW